MSTVTLRGLDEAQAYLARFSADHLLVPALEEGALWMHKRLITYPPERSGQTYERTFDLGASWDITGGGLDWRIASEGVDYNVLVQDEDEQAWMHAGRWTTYQQVAEEGEKRIGTDVEKRLKAATG
jgi:hypothetical protein